ncbi:hypothetical protein J6590_048917 [Homalodisca vitripennis]|nr:hypothetical protein J6590_048917 [Homalodisca vitripennis]
MVGCKCGHVCSKGDLISPWTLDSQQGYSCVVEAKTVKPAIYNRPSEIYVSLHNLTPISQAADVATSVVRVTSSHLGLSVLSKRDSKERFDTGSRPVGVSIHTRTLGVRPA